MKGRDKKLAAMRLDRSSSSFVGKYLAWMRNEDPGAAEGLMADVVKTFTTEEGLRVLILLEKSTLQMSVPDGADDRALREANAVRNFVLEIRRIVAHG